MRNPIKQLLGSRRAAFATSVVALGLTGVAVGLPWDLDLADSQSIKGFSHVMASLPEGTIAQPSIESPVGYSRNYDRMSDEGQALVSPLEANTDVLAEGARMYTIYCTPCHGDGENLGPVAEPGRFAGVVALAGPASTTRDKTDGYLYLTIRNGGTVMPYYGWAMTDDEMWSIVHHVRTLPNAAYVAPEAAADTEEAQQ
jgi:mono/diheme cytochrome c family protein